MKRDRQVESIRQAYPKLAITSVAFGEGGQNNDVVVVNEEWIFRFPRYLEALERLEVETAILQGIEAYVSLEIPEPVYVALEGREIGEAFTGYRRLPGEPLWRETFQTIEDEWTVLRLAGQLGGFLLALHRVPVEEAIEPALQAIGAALPQADTYEECADIYERMQWKLFPQMRPDARRWAAEHFKQFLGDGASFEYEPVLKHGDFGPSNILYD
ncbi:MAG TPA: phosphotransferase, partial [Anaerolineae bacterium]|nr:phosphotransferase [Anaerolineae bacterium]